MEEEKRWREEKEEQKGSELEKEVVNNMNEQKTK